MTNSNYKGQKSRRNNGRFKSATNINNYNKFLSELDTKQQAEETTYYNYYDKIMDNLYPQTNAEKYVRKYDFSVVKNILSEDSPRCCNKVSPVIKQDSFKENSINIFEKEEKEKELKEKVKVNINYEINNISDLLKMIELYPDDKDIEYNIDMHCLHKIKEPLELLNSMIGMKQIKENVVDQILFYIQNLHKQLDKNTVSSDFMHTVIYGPPGTGKTEIAKILGSIFSRMGVLNKGTFKKVTRSDLVAGYLGQTALKTRDAIKDSLGGVLFIDEAYSLGSQEKKDTFSKECIDTLCEALSDHKDNLMVIIAGYETDLNECFFAANQGLNSRFTWRFKIDEYSAADLYNIFIKKINDSGWSMSDNLIDVRWFEKNKTSFKSYGRDIETLFAKTKIAHGKRVFCLPTECKKKLIGADIDKGLDIFLRNDGTTTKITESKKMFSHMYM
jgi:ATP-dependent 26S proteasome regulatory subunit